ncbi:MAG: hypothetical protein PHU49_03620 [Syntrophorhabdaceae bacterium]|nr:hypothetical protein [Syntrophorhabdaceae bacterium]MDD5243084.1 hypothetical protein [Syntrophorhabdaceae bacterium]
MKHFLIKLALNFKEIENSGVTLPDVIEAKNIQGGTGNAMVK